LAFHLLTGRSWSNAPRPGDVLEVRILDVRPRPSMHPDHKGRVFRRQFGRVVGLHYAHLIEPPKPREVSHDIRVGRNGPRGLGDGLPQLRADATNRPRWSSCIPKVDYTRRDRSIKDSHTSGTSVTYRHSHSGAHAFWAPNGRCAAERRLRQFDPAELTRRNIDDWRIGKGATMIPPSRSTGRCSRSAIRMRRKATLNLRHRNRIVTHGSCSNSSFTPRTRSPEPRSKGLSIRSSNTAKATWVIYGFSFPNYTEGNSGPVARNTVSPSRDARCRHVDAFRKPGAS